MNTSSLTAPFMSTAGTTLGNLMSSFGSPLDKYANKTSTGNVPVTTTQKTMIPITTYETIKRKSNTKLCKSFY